MPFNDIIGRTAADELIPDEVMQAVFTPATEQSVALRLATRLPNLARTRRTIRVMDHLPVVYPVGASGAGAAGLKQTTDVDWVHVHLTAEEVAVIVPIDEATLDDADTPIWSQVQPAISTAIASWVDAAILNGTGAFASWPTDIRAAAVAAGNSAAIGAYADLYDAILGDTGVYSLMETDGFMVTGNIAAVGLKARLRGLRDAMGQPILMRDPARGMAYELDGNPIAFPTHGGFPAANTWLISGDFSKIVYAIRQDVNFKVFTEGVIQDGAGNIVYNLMQEDMVALRVTFRFGWALPNPVNAMQAVAANRVPFCVLTT